MKASFWFTVLLTVSSIGQAAALVGILGVQLADAPDGLIVQCIYMYVLLSIMQFRIFKDMREGRLLALL